ncbi:hypothetical protein DQW77_09510 [Roseovarius sp. TE539]|uniref:tetratricopeptide repeat protein n=1 Tax=Roseovarius sp. TE539 TaxID=2249812 RepID=UPI000DE0D280|nr:tetratricopeptide repeat protein [Roseovarius sp. TE539]RBI73081.1 hypothetical protein DQW77_09510 [Roseovarius sp. TE539]
MTSSQPDGRGFFLGQRRDQLGARLLMILTAIRLTEDYRTDFRFNWFPPGADAPTLSNPGELFSEAFMARHFVDNEEYAAFQVRVEPIWKFLDDKTPDALNAHLDAGGHVILDEGFDIIAFPWEDPEALRARFPGLIRKIGFNALIARRIEDIDTALSDAGTESVAYHIRRGDILNADPWMHKQWPSKIEPDELYSAHLRAKKPRLALVFSDQSESIARFRSAHPGVKGIEEIVDLADCTVAQRDFLELYAMSRAGQIVAPAISAFSRAAALISGQARQRFVDVLDSTERDAAYEALLARLKSGVGTFVTPSEAAHLYAKLAARLPVQNREEEAWEIGRIVKESGATNAFVPLFHAINCVYLNRWDEANSNIKQALNDPNLWQESHAAATAIHALVLGALGKAIRCHRTFLRAFWQKPFLPDVTLVGSFMINRRRLKPDRPVPFSLPVVQAMRVPYMRANMFLVQNKFIKRRAYDFSSIVVEWPYFVMDGKAERVVANSKALEEIHDKVMTRGEETDLPERESYCALVQARMGDPEGALRRHAKTAEAMRGHIMVTKRQAEILAMSGRPDEAAELIRPLAEESAKQPYWHYLLGRFLRDCDRPGDARTAWEAAAAIDMTTAQIHSDLAELCRDMGDVHSAAAALDRAAELAPTQQKFVNRKQRYLRKAK